MITYAIVTTRYWYGPRVSKSRHIDDETGQEWQGSHAEAVAMIAKLDESMYSLSHNESGRPVYSIVRA